MYTPLKLMAGIILLLVSLTACRKTDPPEPPFNLDGSATLSLNNFKDSVYLTKSGTLQITGMIEGDQPDYSRMEVFLLNNDTRDTLAKGKVEANGQITITYTNTYAPGRYYLQVGALNLDDQTDLRLSEVVRFYVCFPPELNITSFTKSDTSITVHWSKTGISDFKQYEVYVIRTDTVGGRSPKTPGKLIATIENVNTTSFEDTLVYCYYKYTYLVRVVSADDCGSNSETKSFDAGNYLDLGGVAMGEVMYDKFRDKIYAPEEGANGKVLLVIDPRTLNIEKAITLNGIFGRFDLSADGNEMTMVEGFSSGYFKLHVLDLSTLTMSVRDTFFLPDSQIHLVQNNKVIYSHRLSTTPIVYVLSVLNLDNDQSTQLSPDGSSVTATAQFLNDSAYFVITREQPEFSVYVNESPVPQLRHEGLAFYGMPGAVAELAVGENVYENFFEQKFTLPGNEYVVSQTASPYIVSNLNKVYRYTDGSMVKQFGDGFYSRVFFSHPDPTYMYVFTTSGPSPVYQPGNRLYRIPL